MRSFFSPDNEYGSACVRFVGSWCSGPVRWWEGWCPLGQGWEADQYCQDKADNSSRLLLRHRKAENCSKVRSWKQGWLDRWWGSPLVASSLTVGVSCPRSIADSIVWSFDPCHEVKTGRQAWLWSGHMQWVWRRAECLSAEYYSCCRAAHVPDRLVPLQADHEAHCRGCGWPMDNRMDPPKNRYKWSVGR